MNASISDIDANYITISGNNIFAAVNSNLFISTNSGSSWKEVNNDLSDIYISSVIINGNNIFVGTDEGVFLSTDNGYSWIDINTGLTNANVKSLAISGSIIFAGTEYGGVWKRSVSDITNLTVSSNSINIDASDNSTATFTITSFTNWVVSSSETWLTANPNSGSGNAAITLTAQGNPTSSPRTAIVTVSGTGVVTQSITVTQDGVQTGINKNEISSIKIYPNPASMTLFIKGLTQDTFISIYDLQDNLILNRHLSENQIDISNLANGLYTIKFENKIGIMTRRFVKQ